MTSYFSAPQATLLATQATMDKSLRYPMPGVNVGPGIHVAIQSSWDGKGDCPPGWTRTCSEPIQDDAGNWQLEVSDSTAAKLIAADNSALTPEENMLLMNAITSRVAIIPATGGASALTTTTKVAIGAGIVAAAAGAAELAHLAGLF